MEELVPDDRISSSLIIHGFLIGLPNVFCGFAHGSFVVHPSIPVCCSLFDVCLCC